MTTEKYGFDKDRSLINGIIDLWKQAIKNESESIQYGLSKLEYRLVAKGKSEAYIKWRLRYATDRALNKINKLYANALLLPYIEKQMNTIIPQYLKNEYDKFVPYKRVMK